MQDGTKLKRRAFLSATVGGPAALAVQSRGVASGFKDHEDGKLFAFGEYGQIRWQTETGIASIPVHADGRLYVAGTRGLQAIDPANGEKLWKTDQAVLARLLQQVSAQPPPATDGERVYAVLEDGDLYAFDSATGDERWSYPLDASEGTRPVVADSVLYLAQSTTREDGPATVYALCADTGDALWEFPVDQSVVNGVTVDENTLFVGTASDPAGQGQEGRLYAIDTSTGEEEWTVETDGGVSGAIEVGTTPNGRVGLAACGQATVRAFEPSTGETLWTAEDVLLANELFPVTRRPILTDAAVYLPGQTVQKLDPETGDVLAGVEEGFGRVTDRPAIADGQPVVVTDSGIAGLELDGASRWKTDLKPLFPNHAESPALTVVDSRWVGRGPIFVDGTLYAVGNQWQLTACVRQDCRNPEELADEQSEDQQEQEADENGPGFGVFTALFGLLTGGYGIARRASKRARE